MSLYKNTSQYSKIAKLLHWGFIILFIYGILKQVDDINQLEDSFFLKFEIIFALIFFIVLTIRFIYMKKTQTTSIPKETSKAQKIAAKIVHNGMYLLLFLTVFSGLIIGFLYWLGLKDFYLINTILIIHEFVINLLYWLIGIHIFAAIYHRLRNDGVWSSMVPFFKENK
tara:strand:+ start:104 stop:610 length:507 start_codon:yes stop_codon:yes gene_type:complete